MHPEFCGAFRHEQANFAQHRALPLQRNSDEKGRESHLPDGRPDTGAKRVPIPAELLSPEAADKKRQISQAQHDPCEQNSFKGTN